MRSALHSPQPIPSDRLPCRRTGPGQEGVKVSFVNQVHLIKWTMPMKRPCRGKNAPKIMKKYLPAPKHHIKECSHSSVDSPGARTLFFCSIWSISSCGFRASIACTPFCAILGRSPNKRTNFSDKLSNPWGAANGDLRDKGCSKLKDIWRKIAFLLALSGFLSCSSDPPGKGRISA